MSSGPQKEQRPKLWARWLAEMINDDQDAPAERTTQRSRKVKAQVFILDI